MPNGPRLMLENACYHIYARGNQKQEVFLDKKDYKTYFNRLKKYKKKYKFLLFAFCLMPNHIHLIGQPKNSKNLSNFMHALQLSYVTYFNKRHKKVGHLWQDRFKSKVVIKDRYLLDCMNYIELNPVRARITENPVDYAWSSYKERALKEENGFSILDPLVFY